MKGSLAASGWSFLVLVAVGGCFKGDERVEVATRVHAENVELRRMTLALSSENAALRAALLGRKPWEETVQLRHVGGSGGAVPFLRVCPRGEAVSGVEATGGGYVDSIAPVCTPIPRPAPVPGPVTASVTAPESETPAPARPPSPASDVAAAAGVGTELDRAGGPGGAPAPRHCAAGSHVVGVRGKAGELLDSLELTCQGVRVGGTMVGKPATLPAVGGTGGDAFERRCPPGWVVVGMGGRHGEFLNSIVLHCGKP
jgi:hypothetical protein